MALFDLDTEELAIPPGAYKNAARATMPSRRFKALVTELRSLGHDVAITMGGFGVDFNVTSLCDGLQGAHLHLSRETDPDVRTSGEDQAGEFALSYLEAATKCTPLADTVTLTLADGVPLNIKFDLAPGHVSYFVAPKYESDDDDDGDDAEVVEVVAVE